jgi:hypothetical protein
MTAMACDLTGSENCQGRNSPRCHEGNLRNGTHISYTNQMLTGLLLSSSFSLFFLRHLLARIGARFDWPPSQWSAPMLINHKLTSLIVDMAFIGLLSGTTLNAYLLLSGKTMPFAPTLITVGTALSGLSSIALVLVLVTRTYGPWLLVPMFFAGMAPTFCLVVLCLAGVIDDLTLRTLSVCCGAVSIAVISFRRRYARVVLTSSPAALCTPRTQGAPI